MTVASLPPIPSLTDLAILLDIDGTILDIAPTPQKVVVPETLRHTLRRLSTLTSGALAFVSGRSLDDLDRLFAPLNLRASGVHGAEIRFAPAGAETYETAVCLPRKLWMGLTELLFDFPGTFAENKRFSFAVHYRSVPASKRRLREEH